MRRLLTAAFLAAAISAPAHAGIVIDGIYDADYGASTASVTYNPAAPLGNFGTPGTENHMSGYEIFLTADADYLYGFIDGDTAGALASTNLYFDLDVAAGNGSDLGFEVFNDRAFIPGVGGYSAPLGIATAFTSDASGVNLEFAIPIQYFTTAIAGLSYYPGRSLATPGGTVRLNLSQSLGYSVAGGQANYGSDRLGVVGLSAVPEPATWAMMIVGFGATGLMVRGARRQRAFAAA